jgi:N6-L-threonylcarbamoyladenine synthase
LKVLGIETSCDDTSFAVFSKKDGVIGNLTANQLVHDRYGGVVPEIASREHVKNLLPVFDSLLERCRLQPRDIDGIGVTNGPGLIGSLLVGVGFAKSLALALHRPVVGVHHIEAHILSNEIEGEALNTPAVVLVVSGGHTSLYYISRIGSYELVGNTRDDAAGECFDKIAKLLGLGFPGGPAVERIAHGGDHDAVTFPRAMMITGNQDFSFSGLKTAVRFHVEAQSNLDEKTAADIAASAQEAIVEPLVEKTIECAKRSRAGDVYLAGGVAANGRLREQMARACAHGGIAYHAPLLEYCTDNGAMVACAAEQHFARGRNDGFGLDVFARGPIVSWAGRS